MSIVKTRQTDWWHHLPAISCNERGIGCEVQYISLNLCKLAPLDGIVAVCLVLTIEVYAPAPVGTF